jgi:CBS domain-containing protein
MRTVADAMRAPPVTVERTTSLQEASARMLDARMHAAVVVDGGKVCAIVTADALSAALARGDEPAGTAVEAVAEFDPPVVEAEEALADAHVRMRAADRTVVPVIAADGTAAGLLED